MSTKEKKDFRKINFFIFWAASAFFSGFADSVGNCRKRRRRRRKKEDRTAKGRFGSEQICKPGFVIDCHLSRTCVTARLKPPVRMCRANGLTCGVAPDRVCSCSPLPEEPVSSYLAFPSLPLKAAVYFCCTFPGVASGGRYPLSCPVEPGLSSCQYLSAT